MDKKYKFNIIKFFNNHNSFVCIIANRITSIKEVILMWDWDWDNINSWLFFCNAEDGE